MTASEGFLGALAILILGLSAPSPVLSAPLVLYLLWVLGASLTAVGFACVRPGDSTSTTARAPANATK